MAMRQVHARKTGPGRRHKQGHKTATPKPPKGGDWLGPHTNPEKGVRRYLLKTIGRRQTLKALKKNGRVEVAQVSA